ncbi:hypothetical protein Q5P01_002550 [Channa striata]|uniref:DNA-directed DNA polymerase n=1 Tax=Channa striata TaxID=64152 RepID=A0AA88NMU2_CHASR|nr:hypothetical protein Q5P01_002550 [Channa striata]
MEYSSSRMQLGPLSEAAQKILVVLCAQSLHAARYNCSYSNNQRQMEECNGSQREPWAQSSKSMSQEERKDRNTNQPQVSISDHGPSIQSQNIQAVAYYQDLQTPGSSLLSHSSSCWNSSLQRHMSPNKGYYQHSQMDSHRKYSEPPARQCSRALSFRQCGVSETAASFSQGDRQPLSLQPLPLKRLASQATLWTNSAEEIRPCFTHSPDVEVPNEILFPPSEPSSICKKNPPLAQHPFSSWPEVTETNYGTAGAQNRAKLTPCWNIPRNKVEDTVASDSQLKYIKPLSNHSEQIISGAAYGSIVSNQSNFAPIKIVSTHVRREDTNSDASLPEPIRNAEGQEGEEHIVDSESKTDSFVGQMSDTEKEMDFRIITDVGQEINRFLHTEKRSTSEMERGLRLKPSEDTNSETNSTNTSIIDKKVDCSGGGAKLERKEQIQCNTSECEIKEVKHGSEKTPVSTACHFGSSSKISLSGTGGDHRVSLCQAENPQVSNQTSEKDPTEETLVQCEPTKVVLVVPTPYNLERTKKERIEMMENNKGLESKSRTKAGTDTGSKDKMKTERPHCSYAQLSERLCEPGVNENDRDESLMFPVKNEDKSPSTDTCRSRRSVFKELCDGGNQQDPGNGQTVNDCIRGSSSSVALARASTFVLRQNSSLEDLTSTAVKPREKPENSHLCSSETHSHIPPLKRKFELLQDQNLNCPHNICLNRHPLKFEPPYSLQRKIAEGEVEERKIARPKTFFPKHQAVTRAVGRGVHTEPHLPGKTQQRPSRMEETGRGFERNTFKQTLCSMTCKLPKNNQAKCRPGQDTNMTQMPYESINTTVTQPQSTGGCLTAKLMSDARIKDFEKLNTNEKRQLLQEARQTEALVLTMLYQDGTTQFDQEKKLNPRVSGLLVLMKNNLDCSTPEDLLKPNDSLVYLKLDQTPTWAQQREHEKQTLFTRDVLLQVLSRSKLVVCYKAKDFLRTALQSYKQELTWKQVAGCHIQDPQVSGWLLDPTDPSSCYQDLLSKHCKQFHQPPALGAKEVSQVISDLSLLYWLNMELCCKLQNQGLWDLYSNMELNMIPVLAAMESHCIHVDKDTLRGMSDLLATKIKQLEQEAHQAAGQMFLVTSNSQLRTVLFEKLRLHERCENKRLPKTISKLQQSTSEAALLQLQDFHPLPKVILEYRQVHKIKSTFVDGILSWMRNKNYISSMWCQTSVVTGRISAKHPNFQALPRQPLQVTKKQYIQGKEEEVVTVHPRAMFIPQEGWTFLAADFCQVELRLLAHLSSDPELLHIFTNPQADIFTMLASQWKGVSEGEVTSEDREQTKRIVYSVVFGAGHKRLSGILGVSTNQASQFQDSFLQTYREVQAFIQTTIHQCQKQGYVLSIMGRRRTLPNIKSPDWGIRMQAERQAVNFVVQGSAADLCKMAMIRIFNLVSSSSLLSARLIAQLHDELLYEVEDSHVEHFAALVKSTMESLQHIDHLGVHLKVPLKVAVSIGKSWGSMSGLNITSTSPHPSL